MPKQKKYPVRITIGFTTEQAIFFDKLLKQNGCDSTGQVVRMIVNEAIRNEESKLKEE